MWLALQQYDSSLLENSNRAQVHQTYMHPAYLVANFRNGLNCDFVKHPDVNRGPELEWENNARQVVDGDPSTGMLLLPPVNYTIEAYRQRQKRGRPQERRFRSAGAESSADGGVPARTRQARPIP